MPYKPYWFNRIPLIERWLDAISDPVLDRRGIQAMFGVSQTEAQRLLKRMGALQLAGALVVTRYQVQQWIRTLQKKGEIEAEIRRVEKVEDHLAAVGKLIKARKVRIPVAADVDKTRMEGLPEAVKLLPDGLEVRPVAGLEDLLSHLFSFIHAVNNDMDRFRDLFENEPRRPRMEI